MADESPRQEVTLTLNAWQLGMLVGLLGEARRHMDGDTRTLRLTEPLWDALTAAAEGFYK